MATSRKMGSKTSALLLASLLMAIGAGQASGQSAKPASVKELGFTYAAGKSKLEIAFDGEVTFEKNISEADKQVVIDFKNAKIDKKWARRIDASQHKSNISLISPYQSGDVVRVVLQLKENGGVEVTQEGNKVVAEIDNMQAGGPADAPASPEAVAADASAPAGDAPAPADTAQTDANAASESSTISAVGSDSAPASLENFLEAQRSKNYVGKKIYLQMKDADLGDLFRIIGEASEFNIILTDAVKGKVTVNLMDVPWDQALDLILHNNKLAAERHGNVLRVTTLESLTQEKAVQLAAEKLSEASEPLVVKVFPISYANTTNLKTILEDFLSVESQPATITLPNGQVVQTQQQSTDRRRRGTIQIEDRTNALIVRDTASNIEKIKKVIKELDTQTPQILVEAKFVEVSENKSNQIQGRIFATTREFTNGTFSFNNAKNNIGAAFGGTSYTTLDNGFSITPKAGGASFGFMPKAALLPGLGEIGAFLSILESESSAKVIASPRIVTQNKQAATISQGQTIQLATAAGANAAGGFQTISATLTLSVTPQVTNEGSILMNVNFSQNTPAASSVSGAALTTNTKTVTTNVLVDSGATLVIGGVYTSTQNDSAEGIPILRELPLIGPLFGSKGKVNSKGELFIFITPRVLNDKESGIRG